MIMHVASVTAIFAALLLLWLIPLALYLLSTPLRGLERLNWAIVLAVLSWPAFALYLVYSGFRQKKF